VVSSFLLSFFFFSSNNNCDNNNGIVSKLDDADVKLRCICTVKHTGITLLIQLAGMSHGPYRQKDVTLTSVTVEL